MSGWISLGLLLLALAGCTTKSKANAQARAAFLAGQARGMAAQPQEPSVWIVGSVRRPVIPWTDDLTLAKALVEAEYQGFVDPSQITVLRNGQPPIIINPRELLQGHDWPLAAGDRIEIRP
jgi:hypothetical protein